MSGAMPARHSARLAIDAPASRRSTCGFVDPGRACKNRHRADPRTASSSRAGRNARRAESRGRPSAWLRATAAGTAPCSAFRTVSRRRPLMSKDRGCKSHDGNKIHALEL